MYIIEYIGEYRKERMYIVDAKDADQALAKFKKADIFYNDIVGCCGYDIDVIMELVKKGVVVLAYDR